MPILQLIVLAIIQGLTEFIPVSSSAHLILTPIMNPNWDDHGATIDLAAHFGSLLAVMLYFRKDTISLVYGAFDTLLFKDTNHRKLFLWLLTATIPFVITAMFFALTGIIDTVRHPYVIGGASIFFGIVLFIADRTKTTRPEFKDQDLTAWEDDPLKGFKFKDIFIMGIAQIFAIIPGTSRSGVTISAARFINIPRYHAARISMLLSIPTIMISSLYIVLSITQDAMAGELVVADQLYPVLIVIVLSFIAALASIHLFLQMTKHISFTPFVIYRILLGIALIIFGNQLI